MTNALDSTEVGRPAGTGVLVATCVSTLVVNANTSAVTILLPAIAEDVNALDQHAAMGSHRLLARRRGVHRHVGCPGRRVRSPQGVPRRPVAVHRVVRPHRPVGHPGRRDRRPLHPGRGRLHHPRLGIEPADGGVVRIRTTASCVALGRGISRRGRGRSACRWAARRLDGLAGFVLDRRCDRSMPHSCDAEVDRGVPRSESPTFDRLVRHGAGGHDPCAVDLGSDEGLRMGLDLSGESCCAC